MQITGRFSREIVIGLTLGRRRGYADVHGWGTPVPWFTAAWHALGNAGRQSRVS